MSAVAQIGDERLDTAEPVEHLVDLRHERQPGGRWLDAPACPSDQSEAGLPLQRGELLADRRRCIAEIRCRGIDRTGGDHGPEDAKTVDVEHAVDSTARLMSCEELVACAYVSSWQD